MQIIILTILLCLTGTAANGQTSNLKPVYSKAHKMWGFKSDTGITIPCKYKAVLRFQNGLARVVNLEKKWALINSQGDTITSFIYDDIYPTCESITAVRKDGKWGFIDSTGMIIIPCQYEDALPFTEGSAFVKIEKKWAAIDRNGVQIIRPLYESVEIISTRYIRTINEKHTEIRDKRTFHFPEMASAK